MLGLNGPAQLRGRIQDSVASANRHPQLHDLRFFANADPRPRAGSPALPDEGEGYIGAFGPKENWLQQWTVFGPESMHDPRERSEDEN